MEHYSVTELRANIYKVIDRVIATGEPCEIMRGDDRIILKPSKTVKAKKKGPNEGVLDKLAKLPKRKVFDGTADELVALSGWDAKAEAAWEKKWDDILKPRRH